MTRALLLSLFALSCLAGLTGCPPPPPKAATPAAATPQTSTPAPSDGGADANKTPGAPETPPQPINVGLTPAEGGSELEESAKALEAYLTRETGLSYKVTVPQDYSALIEAMRYDQVQIGALAPLSFVKAETEAGARVLLKSLRHGEPFYYAAIFSMKTSGIKTIADLKGKKMAWGEPLSTSGTIFPKAGLIEAGIDPNTYFSKQSNVGNHEVVVNAVANGDYDAGATFCNTPEGGDGGWEQFLPDRKDEFQVVWVSQPIPADTISVKDTFQDKYPQTTAIITAAFMKLNDTPEGLKMLKDLYRIDGLTEAKSEDYEVVRQAAKLVDVPIQ
ncbi:MAG: phosphate/phosphite/phosphonate ABC transporter substrate-binding protein [bacterium]